MKIKATQQPKDAPADKPLVKQPVFAELDIPLFYATERGPMPWHHSIFCGQTFADTILAECEKLCLAENFALVHLGVYNPRKARHKNGTEIKPTRWSNHAYGEAMDFKGIMTDNGAGQFLDIKALKAERPDFLATLKQACETAINSKGRQAEIVDEGGWLHLGIWPLR
jgi:hypothetical protein